LLVLFGISPLATATSRLLLISLSTSSS
jgi:hypothetical protein